MLWIRKEKVFSGSDYGAIAKRCRGLYLHGIYSHVRGEDPEAPPPLFCHDFCLVIRLEADRLPQDGAEAILAA